jgi:hypothetical protein
VQHLIPDWPIPNSADQRRLPDAGEKANDSVSLRKTAGRVYTVLFCCRFARNLVRGQCVEWWGILNAGRLVILPKRNAVIMIMGGAFQLSNTSL